MSAKVTLLTYTPNPEMTVAMAAKLCYSPSEISNIRDGLTEEKTADFIDMLANIGHGSPFEHASFTFGIEGISRACSHQLVRHRIASYSQQSQRYVDGTKFDFVTPPEIAKNEKALAAYNKVIEMQSKAYSEVRDALVAGYIREATGNCDDTDEEVIENYRNENKAKFNAFVKKQMKTQDLFFLTHQPQKLSALLMQEVLRISLHTAAVTVHSGKSEMLPSKCLNNVLKLLRIYSKTAVLRVCSVLVPRAK